MDLISKLEGKIASPPPSLLSANREQISVKHQLREDSNDHGQINDRQLDCSHAILLTISVDIEELGKQRQYHHCARDSLPGAATTERGEIRKKRSQVLCLVVALTPGAYRPLFD
ncbi:Hypothetical predicted protein [Olea europaea subsp. europaea]|uniref:Uncharacterized protein n=1 Tax=Olea europaea subsp. europaea TaxID=158383 RepID=A0A8S0TV94_OLEEU|nr:Hypothetical predicted protein [Olea europaea subsp. europaea]